MHCILLCLHCIQSIFEFIFLFQILPMKCPPRSVPHFELWHLNGATKTSASCSSSIPRETLPSSHPSCQWCHPLPATILFQFLNKARYSHLFSSLCFKVSIYNYVIIVFLTCFQFLFFNNCGTVAFRSLGRAIRPRCRSKAEVYIYSLYGYHFSLLVFFSLTAMCFFSA